MRLSDGDYIGQIRVKFVNNKQIDYSIKDIPQINRLTRTTHWVKIPKAHIGSIQLEIQSSLQEYIIENKSHTIDFSKIVDNYKKGIKQPKSTTMTALNNGQPFTINNHNTNYYIPINQGDELLFNFKGKNIATVVSNHQDYTVKEATKGEIYTVTPNFIFSTIYEKNYNAVAIKVAYTDRTAESFLIPKIKATPLKSQMVLTMLSANQREVSFDIRHRPANAKSYVWQSNIDGQLSTQPKFTKSGLSQGSHTITLTITNKQDKKVVLSQPLSISDNQAYINTISDFRATNTLQNVYLTGSNFNNNASAYVEWENEGVTGNYCNKQWL